MHSYRFLLVLTALAANLSCRSGGEPAFVKLAEARRLLSDLRINFTKASDASNRAVMADTDEESIKFAHEADTATAAVSAAMPTLARHLTGLGYPGNADLFARFQERFASYQALDREILKLAIENTNLKAQRLLFGPIGQAANDLCGALQALASGARHINDAAVRAQLAVREIQVLQAPHIAEARESEIAKTSLDTFEALTIKLIALSRQNTNVRSLELAMRKKPALTSACDAHLVALQDALATQGFSGTR